MRRRDMDCLDRQIARLLGILPARFNPGTCVHLVVVPNYSSDIAVALQAVEQSGLNLTLRHYAANAGDEYTWSAIMLCGEFNAAEPALAVALSLMHALVAKKENTNA